MDWLLLIVAPLLAVFAVIGVIVYIGVRQDKNTRARDEFITEAYELDALARMHKQAKEDLERNKEEIDGYRDRYFD